MEKDHDLKSSFVAPWTQGAVLALLLGLGALVMHDAPYFSTRQLDDTPRNEVVSTGQDVDARLWQDPIGVVQRARAALPAASAIRAAAPDDENVPHTLAWLRSDIERHPPMSVLAVMLRGGPHAEFVEQRRRLRYAVLAGASAMGFAPLDSDHLGWVEAPAMLARANASAQTIPFEWLNVAPDRNAPPPSAGKPQLSSVLVLWLDDRAFVDDPTALLGTLAERLTPPRGGHPDVLWRIIGPGRSDGLRAMVTESWAASQPVPAAGRLHYYAATPTVPDEVLLNSQHSASGRGPSCPLGRQLHDKLGVQFTRTIGDDAALVRALIRELQLRGLRPVKLAGTQGTSDARSYGGLCRPLDEAEAAAPSHIAVVAEWDTLYGRSLRRQFRAESGVEGYCVDRFNYMRGLDGKLPESAAPVSTDNGKPAGGQAAKPDNNQRPDGTFLERAEGQSQFDYLRRLARQMRLRDDELRRTSVDGLGLRAIGVLGNDVHDKLLVLQALQPEFPNALFFTTDLDARYLHPREQAWARNLIVASSFGLRLDDGLQEGTPPFRDSYQTAVFFTTRLLIDDARHALSASSAASAVPAAAAASDATSCLQEPSAAWTHQQLADWLDRPRIFEIGRTQAFDFSGRPAEQPGTLDSTPDASSANGQRVRTEARCRGERWLRDCGDIHPPGSPMEPGLGLAPRWLLCALVLLAWVPVVVAWDGGFAWLWRLLPCGPMSKRRRRRRSLQLAGVLLLQFVLVPGALAWIWPSVIGWIVANGKPLVFTEGISLWPTELMRLGALLLGGYLLLRGWRGLNTNQARIAAHFLLEQPRHEIEVSQERAERDLPWRTRLVNIFRLDAVAPHVLPTNQSTGLPRRVERLWQRHEVQNRIGARLLRTTVCVLLTLLLTAALVVSLGEQRFVPQRGVLSLHVHEVLHVLVFLMLYVVVFFVADAAVLCVSFIYHLREPQSVWPPETIKHFEQELGFKNAVLIDHWIDLEFLAARTSAVSRLVYYPFIMLSLVLLSRSPAFDDWNMPLSGKLLAALGALIVLGCAMALRGSAERTRRAALVDLGTALMRAHQRGDASSPETPPGELPPPTARQIELLRDHVLKLDRGALAPYSQQPLLKALLLPFATVGGSSLLEYLRLANL